MFRRNKVREPLIRASSPGEFILRTVLLVSVFVLVAWGFWANYERRFTQLRAERSFLDETAQVSADAKQSLRDLGEVFRLRWGATLLVHVRNGAVVLPDKLDGQTVFVGLSAQQQQALVVLPPLMQRVVGENTRLALEEACAQALVDGILPGQVAVNAARLLHEKLSASPQ